MSVSNPLSTEERHAFIQELLEKHMSSADLRSIFYSEDGENARKSDVSPLMRIFTTVSSTEDRPVSRRRDETRDGTLFEPRSASTLLDMTFLSEQAFKQYGGAFSSAIWNCCSSMCFSALAMGGNPRFFYAIRKIKQEVDSERQAARDERSLSSFRNAGVGAYNESEERLKKLYVKHLPFLLGQEEVEGIGGQLCVIATKEILGVSLDMLYRRRERGMEYSSLIDDSNSRARAMRRRKDRTNLASFEQLLSFDCSCSLPCLAEANVQGLASMYEKFAAISNKPKPYENENEYLIDILYDPFSNSDKSYCDRALAEILGIGWRRVMRARNVVKNLIENPALLQAEVVAPAHGMRRYSSQNHPANRTSLELRTAIAQGLDIALRADPAAADGRVTFRFYDPTVNTYEKIKETLHVSMKESIGNGIGELSSRTFKRIFAEYMAERDGSLSFSRNDHNCCPYCQDLELQCYALEMELKSLEREETPVETLACKRSSLQAAKDAHEIHIGWDRMVRTHLKGLITELKRLDGADARERLRVERLGALPDDNPLWRSRKAQAHLTHQDDMTKPNIPSFVQDALSDLARYRPDVTAHVSAITGGSIVMSHELGTGQKTSGSIFEGILLEHLIQCKGESLKIIWNDCAPVGRSFFMCVAAMQFLVDSGLCDLALCGYMANCHGKYLADSLFGQWSRRARHEDITSIDGLLHVFEKIKRPDSASVDAYIVNPVSTVDWQENLARLGYAVSPPQEFGWENMNPHYACAARQSVRETLPPDLKKRLEPLMPQSENCVRITSWPRFDGASSTIPFDQRPIDVPAKQLKPRTSREQARERQNNSEWYLRVPKSTPFAESGPGVVPRSTAAKVGYNSSGYLSQVPLLRHNATLRDLSWPHDFTGPPHPSDADLLVAPENWIVRRTVHCSSDKPVARYPPLNYYNALERRPPREVTGRHKFEATYVESPFPIVRGTSAQSAATCLNERFAGRYAVSMSVLDIYKAVREKMELIDFEELGEFLQPLAQEAPPQAKRYYNRVLKEKRLRIKHRPVGMRTAYQIFRADEDEMTEIERLKEEENGRAESGANNATLASFAKRFWGSSTAQYKKKYEDLIGKEGDRIEKEYADYREWLRERDEAWDRWVASEEI